MQIHSIKINTLIEEKKVIEFSLPTAEFCASKNLSLFLPDVKIGLEKEYEQNKELAKKACLELKQYNIKNFIKDCNLFFNRPEIDLKIRITGYGTYGFYWPHEQKIFINFRRSPWITQTAKHEILHLILEPFIQKKKYTHQEKENLIHTIYRLLV